MLIMGGTRTTASTSATPASAIHNRRMRRFCISAVIAAFYRLSASPDYVKHAVQACIREQMPHDMDHPGHPRGHRTPVVIFFIGPKRPVVEQRPAHDVSARHESPVTRVGAVVAVVAHHEILTGRN